MESQTETVSDGTLNQNALEAGSVPLPVIDISALDGQDIQAKIDVARELGKAAKGSGFFYIKNHGVSDQLIDDIFEASKIFHNKTRSYKMRTWSGFTTNHRGYVPFEENGDDFPKVINFYEAFDLSFEAPENHPDFQAGWRMTGPNVWPDIPGWKTTVSAYYQAVFDLGMRLMEAFSLDLNVPFDTLKKHINCPTSQLRMLKYIENELPKTNDTVGIGAHSDFECFTILLQGAPGLQVMNADDYWIEAPPIPGTFIVNIGDIFETWTGGLFKSTQHRVVNTGNERYSFPLFFGLDYHATVAPLEKFSTPDILEKYPPIKAGQHLMRMSIKTFRYMSEAYDNGEINLEVEVLDVSPFKRTAKLIESD